MIGTQVAGPPVQFPMMILLLGLTLSEAAVWTVVGTIMIGASLFACPLQLAGMHVLWYLSTGDASRLQYHFNLF